MSSLSGRQVYAVDAATLHDLPEAFSPATEAETNLAVVKAHQAWREYRNTTGAQRADFLEHIATGIEDLSHILIDRIRQETAFPEARVIVERNRTCAQLRMFAGLARTGEWKETTVDPALPDRIPAPRPELHKTLMPLGPVVVFGASNFPLAYSTAGGDVASALAVGCPVIVKAHDSHLGTNALVAEVILEAARTSGMPDGVFSSLIGDGFATGKQLVVHPLTAAVGFTGSKAGGRALYDLGQQRENPIPVFAEMGSVNPVFLLPGKIAEDPATLASQLVISMTMTVGQFCTNPGILVAVDDAHTSGLVAAMIEALDKVPGGIMLNASIQKTFYAGVAEINDAKGTTMVYGSVSDTGSATTPVLATVRADVFLAHPRLHHEVFGPFSLLVLCQDIQQMRHVAEAIEGQLTATVQATEAELTHAYSLAEPLMERAGRIILNGVPTGVEVCAAMTHGGPYPASTDSRYTAVGHHAVKRWLRPVTFQNWPSEITSGLFSI